MPTVLVRLHSIRSQNPCPLISRAKELLACSSIQVSCSHLKPFNIDGDLEDSSIADS